MKPTLIDELALDSGEKKLLQQMDGEELGRVTDVKKIFGHEARVVDHKKQNDELPYTAPIDFPRIQPHPDTEGMSAEEMLVAISETDNKVKIARQLGDKETEIWFIQERRLLQNALSRRYGNDPTPIPLLTNVVDEIPIHRTDLGNARRFAVMNKGAALFSTQRSKWAIWDGDLWRWDETKKITDLAVKVVQSIYTEASNQSGKETREALATHATRTESRSRIEAMLALAQGLPEMRTEIERFDQDTRLFNCLDSTIYTRTGARQEHRREDFITMVGGTIYDLDARCPRWEQFMNEITEGDRELVGFLQRSVGYSLTGLTTEQCFWILFGNGSNGKTTFVETIIKILGDYAGQIKTEILLESRYEQKDYHLAELNNKRFVAACESSMGRRLAVSLLKQATGGEQLIARRPYERPFSFHPRFKLWLSTNRKPAIDDPGDAMWRRIYAVPFKAKFIKRELAPDGYAGPLVDPNLNSDLGRELPGILAWATRGCLEYQRDGLNPPRAVLEATKQYRDEEDTLARFFDDCTVTDPNGYEQAGKLYLRYQEWCKTNGEKPEKSTAFWTMLTERGFMPGRTNADGRIRRGLTLKA